VDDAVPTVGEIQERLEALNAALAGVMPFRLALFAPGDLTLLEKNARFMRNDTFAQLVSNVKRDGALASVPLVYAPPGGKPVVLSGNNRVMAAKSAGLAQILCLVVDREMDPQELVSVQLSHNSLVGQDDLPTLKELYDSIDDLALKAYSGLDEDVRRQLEAIKFEAIGEPRLLFRRVTFLFLPAEADEIRRLVKEVEKALDDEDAFLFQLRDYEEFFNLVADCKEKLNIRNSAVALLELLRRGRQTLGDEAAPAGGEAMKWPAPPSSTSD